MVGRVHRKSRRRRSVGTKGYIRKHSSGYLRKKSFPCTTQKTLLRPTRAPARVPPGWLGRLACGMGAVRVKGVPVGSGPVGCGPGGSHNFALFFLSRPSFLFLFFQIPRYFVDFRWSLRVSIIESVFTTHIWSSPDILCRGGLYKLKFQILFNFRLCWLCMKQETARNKGKAELSSIEDICRTSN